MRRLVRVAVLAAALGSLMVGLAPASKAVSSLAYTFVLPCAGGSVTPSLTDLPTGVYEVAVAGACTLDGNNYTITENTCETTPSPVPCTTVGPIQRVPGQVCWTTTNTAAVQPCDQDGPADVRLQSCSSYGMVWLDGACRGVGQSYLYRRTISGPMTAQLYDAWAGHDNGGAVVVTVAWTPLS